MPDLADSISFILPGGDDLLSSMTIPTISSNTKEFALSFLNYLDSEGQNGLNQDEETFLALSGESKLKKGNNFDDIEELRKSSSDILQ